jgi:hypothetical protein
MEQEDRTRLLRRLAQQLGDAIPVVESDHFARCQVCGQFYDLRDFTEVYYHDDVPHDPMKADA